MFKPNYRIFTRCQVWGAGLVCIVMAMFLSSESLAGNTAAKDLLLMPAMKTKHPEKGLLLDITRAGERIVAVGENGRIIYSDDNADSWTQAEVPVCVTLTAVCFPVPEKGWAAGHDGVILHSTDGGSTWAKQTDGSRINDTAFAQVKAVFSQKTAPPAGSPAAVFNEYDWMDFEIYLKDMAHLTEEGATWPFMDIHFFDEANGIAVGAFGMAVETVDGGETWHPFLDRLVNPIGLHYYGIARVGEDLFLAGEMGIVLRSPDMGKTWTRPPSPYEGSFFGVNGTAAGDTVVIFGLRGNAFRSTDRGQSWQRLDVPEGAAWVGTHLLSDGSFVMISPVAGGMISKDRGKTFLPIPNFPGAAMSMVEVGNNRMVTAGAVGIQTLKQ